MFRRILVLLVFALVFCSIWVADVMFFAALGLLMLLAADDNQSINQDFFSSQFSDHDEITNRFHTDFT
jgi:hypothetical protein